MDNHREFERLGFEVEKNLLRGIEPHWPTYREVLALGHRVMSAMEAARAGDVGDYLADRSAANELAALLVESGVEDGSLAAAIWENVVRSKMLSPKQSKALAMGAAKSASVTKSKRGMA